VCLGAGGDCHAMAAGLKAGGFFTFIDKLDENLCEMCVRDLWPGYTLSFECSSLFIFCWVFWGHKKGTFTSVSAVLGLGVVQDTAFFFVVAACVFCFHLVPLDIACGLLAVRANSSVQQSRTGNFVIQNTTDYRSFRLLTHTHTGDSERTCREHSEKIVWNIYTRVV